MRKRKGCFAAMALGMVLLAGTSPLTAHAISPDSGGTIIPEPDPPLEEILEEEVPLAAAPATQGITITDEGVPLTDLPKTGDTADSLPWILLCAGSGALMVTIGLDSRRKRMK